MPSSFNFIMFLRRFQRVTRFWRAALCSEMDMASGSMSGSVFTAGSALVAEGSSMLDEEDADGLEALSGDRPDVDAPELPGGDWAGYVMARESEPLAMATSREARVWWIQ